MNHKLNMTNLQLYISINSIFLVNAAASIVSVMGPANIRMPATNNLTYNYKAMRSNKAQSNKTWGS